MKRIIALLLCCLLPLCFVGCSEKQEEPESTTPIVIIPDYTTKSTVNGYKQFSKKENKEEEKVSNEYYANKSSKKFHLDTCTYAKSIKSENLYTTNSRDELISSGYQPCKKCNP